MRKTNFILASITLLVALSHVHAACPKHRGKECGGTQTYTLSVQSAGTEAKTLTVDHGVCGDNGECDCKPGFSGPDCGTHGCKTTLNDCSGPTHGKCIDVALELQNPDVEQSAKDSYNGIPFCKCEAGWDGKTCGSRVCNPNCQNGGMCVNGNCHCALGFMGHDCGLKACGPNAEKVTVANANEDVVDKSKYIGKPITGKNACNGKGVCTLPQTDGPYDNVHCVCKFPYTGPLCKEIRAGVAECPKDTDGTECSGHGQCATAENTDGSGLNAYCKCMPSWKDTDCSKNICPNGCSKAKGQGTCDPTIRRCKCKKGFTGDDCSEEDCGGTVREYLKGTERGFRIECSGNGQCGNDMQCTCNKGYGGTDSKGKVDCSTNVCQNDCNGRGTCEKNTQTGVSKCACKEGFKGTYCTQLADAYCHGNGRGYDDDCDEDSGICKMKTHRPEKKRCECKPGWGVEKRCTIPECMNNDKNNVEAYHKICSGKGTCSANKKDCTCQLGYVGKKCSRKCPIDEVSKKVCGGPSHGECVAVTKGNVSAAQCKCEKGWGGVTCSVPECEKGKDNEGVMKSCSGLEKGLCVSGTCYCRDGWMQGNCEKRTCPGDCSGRGHCDNGRCHCEHGYTGLDCSQAACCDATCSGNGQCIEGSCKCNADWYGMSCETKDRFKKGTKNCAKLHHCFKHGSCDESDNKCICDKDEDGNPLWKGKFCQMPVCENDCNGNGDCVYSADGLKGVCKCKPGWYGKGCHRQECPNKCSQNGLCLNGTCFCHPGFSGDACDHKRCPNDCSGNGVCRTGGLCECLNGYHGKDCSERPCPGWNGDIKKQCNGNGVCRNGKCYCTGFHDAPFSEEPRWKGDDCGSQTCPSGRYTGDNKLVVDACSNHGSCNISDAKNKKMRKCHCRDGFTGTGCEIVTCKGFGKKKANGEYEFAENKCNGRGQCMEVKGKNPKCECHKGWAGEACEEESCDWDAKANPPGPLPGCHEDEKKGTCHHGQCYCHRNFTGRFCEQFSCKSCDPLQKCLNSCSGGGSCHNAVCKCDQGRSGADCSIITSSFKAISQLVHPVHGKPCAASCKSECAGKQYSHKSHARSCAWACENKCVSKANNKLRSQ